MPYINDDELEFLKGIDSQDLDPLVEIIAGKPDSRRFTEGLTLSEEFKLHSPDHAKYWTLIAGEFQEYGGNTFANFFRGGGVQYREILTDVCHKMKVVIPDASSASEIEMALMIKVLADSLEGLSDEEKVAIFSDLNIKQKDLSKQAIMAALQIAIKAGGFLSYQISVVVANAVLKTMIGRGLTLGGNAALTRMIGVFAGPIGWAITTLWTAFDLASPAYRVTIPGCIYIAYLRQKSAQSR